LGSEERSAFLKYAHLHPTGKFPWQQENALNALLRKRLEPDIITWVNEGRATGAALESSKDKSNVNYHELWDWAAPAANEIIREVFSAAPEEVEEEDEMDTSEDKAKASGPGAELVDILKLTMSARKHRQ
jgi:mediator of RNA polymerase II transcription subunit 8, fungi type